MTKHRRKVGRPRKKPGEPVAHRLTAKMRKAIIAMVEDDLSVEEAAKSAGLTRNAIYEAMKHPPAREFYVSELRALQHCAKHLAVHTLMRALKGDNANASVAAARTLLADDAKPTTPAGMAQTPGFVFMVVDNRGAPAGQALPNGHAVPPMIEHAGSDYAELGDDA